MLECLAVGIGGFIGAVSRYLMGLIIIKDTTFPFMTMMINIIGVCGGFTTFSTFSLESMNLLSDDKFLMAGGYILLSVSLCLLFVYLGNLCVKVLL